MKRKSIRNIIFLTFSFSVLISAAIAIPLGIQSHSKKFKNFLKTYNENLETATNLSNQENFNQNEFVKLARNLKIKSDFDGKLSAKEALDLHFDKFYSFNLNDIVDFSPILAKFPNFKTKLVLPAKKEQVKIEQNTLKNLAVNIFSSLNSINFSTEIELKFTGETKKLEINPENIDLIFKLSNNELVNNKSAVEIAVTLQNIFNENLKTDNKLTSALFKTLSKFGGFSIFNKKKEQILLPSIFEIKPKLQNEKLVFTSIDNINQKLELQLSLFDKKTKKETDLTLEITNLPKKTVNYQEKFGEIFKKHYKFNNNLSRILAFFNISPSKAIFEKLPERLKNHSELEGKQVTDFNFWYKENDEQNAKNEFLEVVKTVIPTYFTAESVELSIDNTKFSKNQLKSFNNKNQIPLVVSVISKPKDETTLPSGLNLDNKKNFVYKFSFVDSVNDHIFSASLENALNPLDESGKISKNNLSLENLKFEVKQNLSTTVFASMIDEKISHLKNKPLNLKNLNTLEPLFSLLNSSFEFDKDKTPELKKVKASATFFAEEEKELEEKEEISNRISLQPGTVLKQTLTRLTESPIIKDRSVYLSSEFTDKYNLILDIKKDEVTEKSLKLPIDSVITDNKPYKLLQKETNLFLFLDWNSNLKTTSKIQGPIDSARNYVDSITALNNTSIEFVPGKPENGQGKEMQNEEEIVYPFKSQSSKGIYLSNQGLELKKLDNSISSDEKKNITLFYVFKPAVNIFYPPWVNFSLLKSTKNSSTNTNENSLNLLIRNYFVPGFNLIGADFRNQPREQQQLLDNRSPNSLIRTTFNGDLYIELRPDGIGFDHISSNNSVATNQDFLSNTDATVMVKLKIEQQESGKGTAKLFFYTSEASSPYKPVLKIEEENIDFSGFSFKNNLKLGILPSKPKDEDAPYLGSIIFKSLAIFENSKTIDDKQIVKSFIDQYFDIKDKTK